MKVFAVYNSKGGVGKTASAVNLAYLSSLEGRRTLIWDLDPQGSTSFYYETSTHIKGGAKKLVEKKSALLKAVHSTKYEQLEIIPSDFSVRNLDLIFDDLKKSKKRLREMLKTLDNDYETIVLDCPPGFSLVSENIFYAASHILVPLIPTHLSLRTYSQISHFFVDKELDTNKIYPFFSMVDKRKKIHKTILEEYSSQKEFLPAQIPYSSIVEKMGEKQAPLPVFSKSSVATQGFRDLWNGIKDLE